MGRTTGGRWECTGDRNSGHKGPESGARVMCWRYSKKSRGGTGPGHEVRDAEGRAPDGAGSSGDISSHAVPAHHGFPSFLWPTVSLLLQPVGPRGLRITWKYQGNRTNSCCSIRVMGVSTNTVANESAQSKRLERPTRLLQPEDFAVR